MAPHGKPYYRAYPTNFLSGTFGLKADEHGIYRTLLDLMYDKWAPVPWDSLSARAKREQQQNIARQAGTTVRRLNEVVLSLFARKKIIKTDAGDLTNDRFEVEFRAIFGYGNINSPVNIEKNGEKKSGKNDTASNNPKRLQDDSCARESILQSLEARQSALPAPVEGLEERLTPARKCADALGVNLQSQTWRAPWIGQILRMISEDGIDVDLDMIPVLRDARQRKDFKPEAIRSMAWFRKDFIAHRDSRRLTDHLRRPEPPPIPAVVTFTEDEWFNYLRIFLLLGAWLRSTCGPAPTEPGCLAPRSLLIKAAEKWKSQGNHPASIQDGNSFSPWAPDRSLFKTPAPFIIPAD